MDNETRQITKNMTMGEIIQKWPAAADIMQSYGLQCLGCHINIFESLEEGVLVHGMNEEEMNKLLDDLNNMADESAEKPESESDLNITELAAEKLKDLIENQGKQGYGIRVSVLKGGCAGYTYDMDFEKVQQKNDRLIELYGIKIFVDDESFKLLAGVTIDYAETLQGAGFRFDNPNATIRCGCGKSFK